MKTVAACGVATMDWLASVDSYPQPDQKIRTTSLQKMCGGNAANVIVSLARLGVKTKMITKLGSDQIGDSILKDLSDESVDTSHILNQFLIFSYFIYAGQSSFSYIIVDTTSKSRTIINTPGLDLSEDEISPSSLLGVDVLFLDGRHSLAAKKLAQMANTANIPVILELENPDRPLIWDLLPYADFIVSSSAFPPKYLKHQQEKSQVTAKDSFQFLFSKCIRAKWIISTFGSKGSVLIEKIENTTTIGEGTLDIAIEQLINSPVKSSSKQPHIQIVELATKENGETINYKIYHCSVWPCNPDDIIDTTGAGDSFNGGIIYSFMQQFPIPKMLIYIAAENCKKMGGRGGLKKITDIDMTLF